MAKDVLTEARKLMRLRFFEKAIITLEARSSYYEDNFDYYLLLAIAYLYTGDTGSATVYFQKARQIRLTDTDLLLGQAALFLRRGDTARAIQYYLDILEYDPQNKIAHKAMEFIRTKGDYETICKWVDIGKIEEFYPSVGISPVKIMGVVIPLLACVLGFLLVFTLFPKAYTPSGNRVDLSELTLSIDERKNLQESDLSSGAYKYILSSSEIEESYLKAQKLFEEYRDNACQVEINRILNSNAVLSVKQKARLLMEFIEEPTFDTVKDVPSYKDVSDNPSLYLDCWVVWSGRISNVQQTENLFICDLLVGYETMQRVEGIVPLSFSVVPSIEVDKPVTVLAKIISENGKMGLQGRAVYQSVKENLIKLYIKGAFI